MPALLGALEGHDPAVHRAVAFGLFVLTQLDENKIAIGADAAAIPRLIDLLASPSPEVQLYSVNRALD